MIRAIIIDDEDYVREELKERVRQKYSSQIEIIEEAAGVSEAKDKINRHNPDLVFLDIDLTDGTGFDVIEQLDDVDFQIIFVTGFDDQAIKAIKIGALDYVLKPVDDEEFDSAVEKAIKACDKKNDVSDAVDVANNFYNQGKHDKIVLRTLDAHHVVYFDDILYCKSDGNYTTFYLSEENIIISKPLKKVETLLNESLFLKCHQSYMVNTTYVTKYTNEGCLILKTGQQIPVASRRKDTVLKRIF